MATHRSALPQLGNGLFLTDGGIETTLIFLEGLELPEFAAFHLLRTKAGEATLRRYFETYAALAGRHGAGLVLESPTWRASRRAESASAAGGRAFAGSFERSRARFWESARIAPSCAPRRRARRSAPASATRLTPRSAPGLVSRGAL